MLQRGDKYFRILNSAGQLIQLEDFLIFSATVAPPYTVTMVPEVPTTRLPVTLSVRHARCPAFSGFVRNDRTIDITLPSTACPEFDSSVITTTFALGLLPVGTYTVRFLAGSPPTPFQTFAFAIVGGDEIPTLDTLGLLALSIALGGVAILVLMRRGGSA